MKQLARQVAAGKKPSDPIYGSGDAGKRIADVLASAELTTVKQLAY